MLSRTQFRAEEEGKDARASRRTTGSECAGQPPWMVRPPSPSTIHSNKGLSSALLTLLFEKKGRKRGTNLVQNAHRAPHADPLTPQVRRRRLGSALPPQPYTSASAKRTRKPHPDPSLVRAVERHRTLKARWGEGRISPSSSSSRPSSAVRPPLVGALPKLHQTGKRVRTRPSRGRRRKRRSPLPQLLPSSARRGRRRVDPVLKREIFGLQAEDLVRLSRQAEFHLLERAFHRPSGKCSSGPVPSRP